MKKNMLLKDLILSESLVMLDNVNRSILVRKLTEHINKQIRNFYLKIENRLEQLKIKCYVENKFDSNFNIIYIITLPEFNYQMIIRNAGDSIISNLEEYVNITSVNISIETNDDFNKSKNETILCRRAVKDLYKHIGMKTSTDTEVLRLMEMEDVKALFVKNN